MKLKHLVLSLLVIILGVLNFIELNSKLNEIVEATTFLFVLILVPYFIISLMSLINWNKKIF